MAKAGAMQKACEADRLVEFGEKTKKKKKQKKKKKNKKKQKKEERLGFKMLHFKNGRLALVGLSTISFFPKESLSRLVHSSPVIF